MAAASSPGASSPTVPSVVPADSLTPSPPLGSSSANRAPSLSPPVLSSAAPSSACCILRRQRGQTVASVRPSLYPSGSHHAKNLT